MKDMERLDQIKAMKKAWEMAESGRYAKVPQRFTIEHEVFSDMFLFADLSQSSLMTNSKWYHVFD